MRKNNNLGETLSELAEAADKFVSRSLSLRAFWYWEYYESVKNDIKNQEDALDWLAKRIGAWLACSHFNAWQIRSRYKHQAQVIFNGVDTAQFQPSLAPSPLRKSLGLGKDDVLFAFAGIANPEKFFRTLHEAGCVVEAAHGFADHHPFTPDELRNLRDEAENRGARLVTTEKDAARLSANDLDGISVVSLSLEWEDEPSLDAALRPLFGD